MTKPRRPQEESSLRAIPPVHEILALPVVGQAVIEHGYNRVVEEVRRAVARARALLLSSGGTTPDAHQLAQSALAAIHSSQPALRRVINATGILLHTGLGRAPLATQAIEAVARVASGYCDLEFDLDTGERGQRVTRIANRLREIAGADAATVVNNNAAATVLALRALARDREVIVSRGELVEIGGSFRLPEIFEASGATLREVGTTNRTRISDYEKAIHSETAAILRVHPSNFRIVGFTEAPAPNDLARLAHAHDLWFIDDIGSGALAPGCPLKTSDEPTITESLAAGADLVLCSGDKLLGGPQCGLMLGTGSAISRIMGDPLMRAFRVDKLTLAALDETLRLASDPELAMRSIPLWKFLHQSIDDLRDQAIKLAIQLTESLDLTVRVVDSTAFLGGGSMPVAPIPSIALHIRPGATFPDLTVDHLSTALRQGEPAVVGRIQAGDFLLDLKAVSPTEIPHVFQAFRQVFERSNPQHPR